MEWFTKAWEWIAAGNGIVIIAALLALSEVLALVPQIKANSIFQAIVNAIKWMQERLSK